MEAALRLELNPVTRTQLYQPRTPKRPSYRGQLAGGRPLLDSVRKSNREMAREIDVATRLLRRRKPLVSDSRLNAPRSAPEEARWCKGSRLPETLCARNRPAPGSCVLAL